MKSPSIMYALYCSLETAQGIGDAKEGIPAIVKTLQLEVEMLEQLSHYSFVGWVTGF